MNRKQRVEMYPVISYNNVVKCEQRWNEDANVYGDISTKWQVSLGNGKRLNRKWKRCGGLAIIQDPYHGGDRTIYNENYDVEWQKALNNRDLAPPKGLTRLVAMDYDRSYQPDNDPDFYSSEIQFYQ